MTQPNGTALGGDVGALAPAPGIMTTMQVVHGPAPRMYGGTGFPPAGLGVNGDVYFRADTGAILIKSGGVWPAGGLISNPVTSDVTFSVDNLLNIGSATQRANNIYAMTVLASTSVNTNTVVPVSGSRVTVLAPAGLTLGAGSPAGVAGQVTLSSLSAATATTGASGAPPAQVAGYLTIYVGTTPMKIPYYAN
jgi:hypothetical protein